MTKQHSIAMYFPFPPPHESDEVKTIDLDKPENSALVTALRYHEALDLPIDALQKIVTLSVSDESSKDSVEIACPIH